LRRMAADANASAIPLLAHPICQLVRFVPIVSN
jgi:hypothetical protein